MQARHLTALVALLTLILTSTPELLAGSGTRSSGRQSYGSGARSQPQRETDVLWAYEGTLEKGELHGEKEAQMSGRFRLEGESIFSVPEDPQEEAELQAGVAPRRNVFRNVSTGADDTEPRKIGSFRVTRSGKLTLIFDDEEGLNGAMVLSRRRRPEGVWAGAYREREGKKTVRTWQITAQTVED